MASSTTPIPPMRADWTASGACTSGSTAHPRGATRRASGGAATTSTTRAERSRGCRGATAGTGDLTTPLLHEAPDELRNLIRCGIEREMTRIEDVECGSRHVAAIGLRFRKVERRVVFAPEDEKPRLLLAHPSLPRGVGVHVPSVVVEEVALNVGLAWLAQEGVFVGPQIGIVLLRVRVVADVTRPRGVQREQVGPQRRLV